MNEQVQNLTFILEIILGIIVIAVIVATVIYVFMKMKMAKMQREAEEQTIPTNNKTGKGQTKETGISGYNKQSIFNFMEFDKIEDNMIIQKNGKRFLMVIECQGVNYDLMSDIEKTGVEEGFVQFLNTLRHPIQLYVQTRTLNLEKSIANYKARLKEVEDELNKMEMQYTQNSEKGIYTKEEKERAFYDLIKQRNLYEYSKDIIFNTEQMNKNRSVLNKKYYIVIPYYSEEAQNDNLDKDEIKGLAFSELYTRAQSIARALSATGVVGRILNSVDLVDFLYVAYNRDESETFGIDTAIKAGFDELYSTAPDVLEKKKEELEKQIEEKAVQDANNRIKMATIKEQEIQEMIDNMDDIIEQKVKELLEDNKEYIGEDVANIALEDLEREKKGESTKDVGTKKKTKRTRKKAAV